MDRILNHVPYLNHKSHNLKLYVIRLGINNELLQSRPCDVCLLWLIHFSIKKVIYTDSGGNLVEKKVKNLVDEEDQHVCSGKKHMLRMINDKK